MRSKRLSSRPLLVVAVAGLLIGLALALPADSAVRSDLVMPIYMNRCYSFAERAADLVSRMTLAQKASQMNSSYAPAIRSLGVPQWGWWNEALHGSHASSCSTTRTRPR